VLKGASGITSLAASSVAALNPAVSTLLAHQVRMRRKAFLAKALPYRYWDPSTEPTAEWVEAQELLAGARGTGILKDLAFLSKNSARYDRTLDREITRINRLREVARQQAISGPIIGLANVAQSLSATIAAYSFTDAPINGNRLLLAGRISKIGGQGYSMANTGLARFRKTFYDRRLKKQGLSPDQVFEERLRRLDKLETQVKAATPPDESRY